MKLADRIAAWFGYVPRKPVRIKLAHDNGVPLCEFCETECVAVRPGDVIWMCECRRTHYVTTQCWPTTRTTVVTPPHILVSADFKRGIPCS